MKRHLNKPILLAILSFVIWGLFPPYFKLLDHISAFEIILHRIIWSFVLMSIVILCIKPFVELRSILSQKSTVLKLICTSLLISTNWLVFVYAVATNRVLETSLGYYTSPLLTILLGLVFLKEKIGSIKKIAITLTLLALIIKMINTQNFSYITIILACTFSAYSLIKKTIKANSVLLFFVETTMLVIPALITWTIMLIQHKSSFNISSGIAIISNISLLIGLGILTSIPLLLFNRAVLRIDLSVMGFIQYITPTMTFLMAVLLYKEPFYYLDILVFLLIWIAILLVNIEMRINYLNKKKIFFVQDTSK